jgi:hypothetical protein
VPKTHANDVKEALSQSGAGHIDNYSDCMFTTEGIGQFRPNDAANPAIGEAGRLEEVEEVKIETIVSKDKLDETLKRVLKVHPYEVPAYDIYKLENKVNEQGIGMYGYLEVPKTLEALTAEVKQLLNCDTIRFVGKRDQKISKVGIITGSGAEYFRMVKPVADVLITGDLKYHEAQEALQINLGVIDAGHFETEQIYTRRLQTILREAFEEKAYDLPVMVSEVDLNPFQIL